MPMDPLEIISRTCEPGSRAFRILKEHGELIARKALSAAARVEHLNPDRGFIENACMLHDIGIVLTDSPGLGCRGSEPYICHGVLGRGILDALGLPRHGLVCERHVGVGIAAADVRDFKLPLPERDMLPVSIEEQIICYADKFYSKKGGHGAPRAKPLQAIVKGLRPYGEDKLRRFLAWVELFG
jgi:uncharacterized protein